jgi:hypothetical protein
MGLQLLYLIELPAQPPRRTRTSNLLLNTLADFAASTR